MVKVVTLLTLFAAIVNAAAAGEQSCAQNHSRAIVAFCIFILDFDPHHFCAGSPEGSLNLTLQLTTKDFLPVATLLRAAASVWVSLVGLQPHNKQRGFPWSASLTI